MFQPDQAMFAPAARSGLAGLFGPGITPLEQTVIALARKEADEGRWSETPSRFALIRRLARVGRFITGRRPRAGLADERLEALRRFVALIRRHDRRAGCAGERLRAHGYEHAQLARIEALALA